MVVVATANIGIVNIQYYVAFHWVFVRHAVICLKNTEMRIERIKYFIKSCLISSNITMSETTDLNTHIDGSSTIALPSLQKM